MVLDATDQADDIFGRSIIGADSISQHFRGVLGQSVQDSWVAEQSIDRTLSATRPALLRATSLIAEHYQAMETVALLAGLVWAYEKLPGWLADEVQNPQPVHRFKPPEDPPLIEGPFGDLGPEELRFPIIEEGARRLRETGVLDRDTFDATTEAIRHRSFTVAGDIENETVDRIRNVLADDIESGTSFDGFRQQLHDTLESSFLGPGHLETVYRTNVQSAFRDGRQTLMSDPIVAEAFPYQAYIPINDDRVRDSHLALQNQGLNGTNIYRTDDPFWDFFTPPWDFNCRCAVNLVSIDQAAAAGVEEAQRWLDSGRRPENPQHVFSPGNFPIEPNPGWGSRGRVGVPA